LLSQLSHETVESDYVTYLAQDSELDLSPKPVRFYGDRNQIEQAVMNIVINASEAMPEGGRIVIQTRNVVLDYDDRMSLYGVKPGKYGELLISDTGKGMGPFTLEKIFQPFFSTKQRGSIKGAGLGLSVVQGIIESHGGHIKVESQPDKGTEFRIYLPAIVE
ncbi:MAG: ATP-binding protein, partial [Pseudomonadota bacterium]